MAAVSPVPPDLDVAQEKLGCFSNKIHESLVKWVKNERSDLPSDFHSLEYFQPN